MGKGGVGWEVFQKVSWLLQGSGEGGGARNVGRLGLRTGVGSVIFVILTRSNVLVGCRGAVGVVVDQNFPMDNAGGAADHSREWSALWWLGV